MRINDEDRVHVIAELRAERRFARQQKRLCLDTRSPDYNGPDEHDEEGEGRIYAFAEAHRARQIARNNARYQVASLAVESLRVMLDAYDAEQAVDAVQLELARVHLAAWELVKDRP